MPVNEIYAWSESFNKNKFPSSLIPRLQAMLEHNIKTEANCLIFQFLYPFMLRVSIG